MSEQDPNRVVVAVGHDPIDAALAYAADEAIRAGCGLHLVHVVHSMPQGPEVVLTDVADLELLGRQTLTAAFERAGDLLEAAGVTLTKELLFGPVVASLVEAAGDARMIVLEHRELPRMRRVVTRSVASGVAAHARAPVVSVPSRWQTHRDTAVLPTVTVGVDIPDRAGEVLHTAAEAARTRGATLHVLHTRSFPSGWADAVVRRMDEQWAARVTAEIETAIAELGEALAGVPLRIETRNRPAADALIEASQSCDLLVVGRHDPLLPLGSHLGPVARAVLREAACPVLLASPRPWRRWNRDPGTRADVPVQHS
jgi:nucleotide-binding universal stress UspA family protein